MKITKYFLLTLLSVGLFACSNDDDDGLKTNPGEDARVKSITVSIKSPENLTLRSVVAPTTDTKIQLAKAYILFCTSMGEVWDVQTVESDGSGTAQDPINKLISTDGVTFHDISDAVTQIAVIGNPFNPDMKTFEWFPPIETPVKGNLLSTLENSLKISAAGQQDQDYITLYGKGNLGDPVDEVQHGVTGATYDTYIYKPEITVNPLVARFEIGNIQCEDLGNVYGDILIAGLGLVDFYEFSTLAGTASNKLLEGVYKVDANGDVIERSGHIFDPGLANPGGVDPFYNFSLSTGRIGWRFVQSLESGANPRLTDPTDIYNPLITPNDPSSDRGVFAFNFIPKADEFPNVKLWLGIYSKDNPALTVGGNWFVTTSGFNITDATVQHPAPGYIYTLDFKFKEENIGDYNHDNRCADINVTATPWTLTTLEPVFN